MTTTIIFALIFFVMIGYYVYFLVVESHDVVNNDYNKRIDGYAETVVRGTIFSADGDKLAYTKTDDAGNETREYPYDELFSHVIGIKNHGKSGLEKVYNYELLSTNVSPIQKIVDDFMNVKEKGNDVYTTLDVSLQKSATDSLGKNKGAVVIIDPESGAIKAMTSKPNYNPNTIDDIWDKLAKDTSDSRLVNRATQGKYTPGSIFKIVTTLEYMRENKNYNDFHFNCVDIYTGTLGKAFGGALGGFTTGRKEIIDLLRQRSRPYLFSNSLAPGIIGASLEVFKMLKESNALHDKLVENVNYFRDKMTAAGFDIKPTQSAICAVMLYDAKLSQIYAARMQEEGIYVTGFYYPVVPKDQARIRVQISAGHEKAHLDKCIAAFIKVGKELNVLKAE